MKSITPAELQQKVEAHPIVLEAINQLLVESGKKNYINLYQEDIIKRIYKLDKTLTNTILSERCMLDIEDVYRKAGWKVEYRSPSYHENFREYFIFSV